MSIRTIPVDEIVVVPGHNYREEFETSELEQSLETIGLLHPICVRLNDEGEYLLNSGERRLRAARKLGWALIEARVLEDVDDITAELTAIDENIIRRDLQGAALDKALARRKELYLQRYPDTAQHVAGGVATKRKNGHDEEEIEGGDGPPEPPKSFVEDTADKTGKSGRTIERSVRRAERLSDKTMAAYEAGQINQTQADILAALPHDEQDAMLDDVVGKSVEETRRLVSGDLPPAAEEEDVDRAPMQILEELYMHGQKIVGLLDQLHDRDDLGPEFIASVENLADTLAEEFGKLTGEGDTTEDENEDDDLYPPEPPF